MKTLHTKEDFYILYADDLQMEIQIKGSESGNTIAVIPNVKEYESMGEAIVSNPETRLANAKLFFAAKDMLEACRSALADLEGIMPVHDPNGDRLHPAWKTIEELRSAIKNAITGTAEQTNLKRKLPEWCFALHPKKHIIIRINRGESGFSPTIPRDLPRDIVKNENMSLDEFIDCLNEEIEVTPGQRKAMVAGSMWGWHTKLADPDMYDEEGVVMLEKL